jgi:hypothetical protein
MLKNCGHSMKWKELAVNRMLLVMIKRRANTFFMIVQRKVLKAAGGVCYDREALESRKEHKPRRLESRFRFWSMLGGRHIVRWVS